MAVIAIIGIFGQHTVPEGHVGIYYRLGALLDQYSTPGLHFFIPFITHGESLLSHLA
jgi:regulator of protease activity HflC (stomatin/prohibitin superfamily)